MNAADMWTIATSLADSPIPKWFAGFLIASTILAALILLLRPWLRRLDRELEERRRVRDLNKFRNAVITARADLLVLDEATETVTWTKESTW